MFSNRYRRLLGACLAAAPLVLAPGDASGHKLNKSFVDLLTTPAGAEVIFDFDTADLEEALLGRLDGDGSGQAEEAEAERHRALLDHLAGAGLLLERGGEPCTASLAAPLGFSDGMVRARLRFACPAAGAPRLRVALLDRLQPGHKTFLAWRDGEAVLASVLDHATPSWAPPASGRAATVARFALLGVEHILLGYDHLLFLFALVLATRRLGALAAIVTSFTVAHSITLALAGLELVRLSADLVEPAIALTIVYVGVENLWRREPKHRWLVTFILGLVHGFGFAGLLGEIGLPAEARGTALFAFNLGVEIGQLAMVLAITPGLLALRRQALGPRLRLLIAAGGLGLAGLLGWFVPWAGLALGAASITFVLLVPRYGYERVVLVGASAAVTCCGLVFLVARVL